MDAPILTIDYREKELIPLLDAFQPLVKALPVGDVWIGVVETDEKQAAAAEAAVAAEAAQAATGTGGLVIERKTVRDLEASLLDGRYREQRGRILSFCHQHKAQPIYVLEGAYSSSTGRVSPVALQKIVNRLALRYQIPVFRTVSAKDTAEWVQGVVEQWREDPTALQRTTDLVKVSDGIHVQKKANAADPRQFLIHCMAQCPGVSVKMAEQIAASVQTMEGWMAATKESMQEIKVGARRVGPAVAQRMYDLIHSAVDT